MKWDVEGKKRFQSGIDHVALYVAAQGKYTPSSSKYVCDMPTTVTSVSQGYSGPEIVSGNYEKGVAWNGVTAINENPSGGETTTLYADNIAYLNMQSAEKYGFSIEAYDYPDEWEECDGTAVLLGAMRVGQQKRSKFALTYRTLVGTDTGALGDDEILHWVWGCSAAVSAKNHQTVNESPEAATMSWECTANTVTWTTKNRFNGTAQGTVQTSYPIKEYKTAHISVRKSDCTGTNARNKNVAKAYDHLFRTAFGDPSLDSNDGLCLTPEGIWLTLNFYDDTVYESEDLAPETITLKNS